MRGASRLVEALAATDDPPDFVSSRPLATFEDARTVQHLVTTAIEDIERFSEPQQQQLLGISASLDAIVAAGATEFGDDDVSTVLAGAAQTINILTTGACDGFLRHH